MAKRSVVTLALVALALAPPAMARQVSGQALPHSRGMEPDFNRKVDQGDIGTKGTRASGNPPQVGDARKLAEKMGVPCDVVDAAPIADRAIKNAQGQKVHLTSYELACRDAVGWIISTQSDGVTESYDCLALQVSAKAAGKNWNAESICRMRVNLSPQKAMSGWAGKMVPGCDLADATYLGQGGTPPIIRYEIMCRAKGGYIVDSPSPGSSATASSMSCKDAAQAGVKCSLPTPPAG